MSAELSEDLIYQTLDEVTDPDQGDKGLSSLGMIKGVQIDGAHVVFSIEVDPQKGSAMEGLRQQAEAKAAQIPGVEKVTAVLTAERAAKPAPTIGHRAGDKKPSPPLSLPHIKNIIAVASGKGGVGKSTVAANLAVALSRQGLKTALMDADIYGPSVPKIMGVEGQKPDLGDDQKLIPIEAHGVKLISIGFMVDEDAPMIWRGPMVQSALQQFFVDVNWGDIDVMVVDMPPGTGDAQLTLAQKVTVSGAVIVSTPQDLALIDAKKGINMFRKVDIPILGLVENMSVHVCPQCGHESHIFGHGTVEDHARTLDCPFLGALPLSMDIRAASDEGRPLTMSSEVSNHFQSFAKSVMEKLETLS